jgi:hypothetical protein
MLGCWNARYDLWDFGSQAAKMVRMLSIAITFIAHLCLGQVHGQAQISSEELEFFEKQVRPILVARCYGCHSAEKTSGGLALDFRQGWQIGGDSGPAIVAGTPQESLLIDAINYRSLEMPPSDSGEQLSQEEIRTLTEWVQRGAPDPRERLSSIGGMTYDEAQAWWAFQPLPAISVETNPADIDSLIDARLKASGLAPSGPADKRSLIRRATYDLTGLPPTAEEVQAFLEDESPNAFNNVIERLLASPQYGVRWGRHWLDVVRYADTAGENTDRPLPHAWRYRNWVIDSFNRDLPFAEFVKLQIAGDILCSDLQGNAFRDGIIATGYLAIARRFGHDIDQDIHLMHEDVIDNLGKNFLGLTIGCARCHDHKYDPISAEDYYALYGVFDSSRFSFPGCEAKGQPRDLMPLLSPAELDVYMADWREETAQMEAEKKRREELVVSPARLQELAAPATQVLIAKRLEEGESASLNTDQGVPLPPIQIKQGEVLLLGVSPNESHGADTTMIEWTIQQSHTEGAVWHLSDAIDDFTSSNPRQMAGAHWFYLESTDGPQLLASSRDADERSSSLQSWSNEPLPNVFVNSSHQPVVLWTTLPARSVFVHPAPERSVGIAWRCPADGQYSIAGTVADAHPGGPDGISFSLQHIASSEYGDLLLKNGQIITQPLPEPGPAPLVPVAYAVAEATAKNARLHIRGDHEKLGPDIPRHWLTVLGGNELSSSTGSGRKELAELIAIHPLTARVMVNRIWQGHFGYGLVRSPNDFGSRGEPPTHPELLERLSARFVAQGGSIKSMHRLMMSTAAYQRSSARSEHASTVDPENRLLSHFPRRRLSAEEIRDSFLFASQEIDLSPGEAHPFPPESTWTFTQHGPFTAVYETNRRSAYLMVQRQRRHPYLALFDGADTNSSTAVRQTTTVPTQALYFMNDPFFHQQAAALAASLTSVGSRSANIEALFQRIFQRPPHDLEIQLADRFFENYPRQAADAWAAYVRVLLSSNEFLHID